MLQCFCEGMYRQYGLERMLKFEFPNPVTGGRDTLCWSWFQSAMSVKALLVLAAVGIVVVNYLLKVHTTLLLTQTFRFPRLAEHTQPVVCSVGSFGCMLQLLT